MIDITALLTAAHRTLRAGADRRADLPALRDALVRDAGDPRVSERQRVEAVALAAELSGAINGGTSKRAGA